MIDFHAHAYPDASATLPKGTPAAVERTTAKVSQMLSQKLGRLHERVASRLPLPGIGAVAALQGKLPAAWERRVEQVSSMALAGGALLGGTVEGLLASMDRTGIERTVLIGAPPVASNRWLLEAAVPKAPDRLIPVTTLPVLPPPATEEAWVEAFVGLVESGARGFKIHGNLDGLPADHVAYRALFQVAAKRKRFVILHTGCFHALGFKREGDIDILSYAPLFDAYPEVPVCLAHMGRASPERAWEAMRRHPQLYADTSWQPEQHLRAALRAVSLDRLLLGSDWPLLHLSLQADAVGVLRRAATDAELEAITRTNPERLLGASA